MRNQSPFSKYLILFVPWFLAWIVQSLPILSYLIAWSGSLLIFAITISGWVNPIPKDLTLSEQLMRPLFMIQIIFAGYMCVGSIFYFLNVLGYVDFHLVTNKIYKIDIDQLKLTAECQRYYVLGHAAFVTGILRNMNYPIPKKYFVEKLTITSLLLKIAFAALFVSTTIGRLPGFTQLYWQFANLSFISGTLALALAIPQKRIFSTLICSILYVINFYTALTSGFKEPIIISVLVLGIFLYPNYKRIVVITFIPILLLFFIFLPKFNQVFRESAWKEGVDIDDAYELALDATIESEESGETSNWDFLTGRLSEIGMFTQYVESTPKHIDYYNFEIVRQSIISLVPREIWPEKPVTELLVMKRVYAAGVTGSISVVSAKPAFIVDCYLSFGAFGVFIFLYLYGMIAQRISQTAEYLFGGYLLGTALIFSGLFQSLWRGLSFEFIANSVFWSFVSMLIIFQFLKILNVIKKYIN
jgi:hypothetical protein